MTVLLQVRVGHIIKENFRKCTVSGCKNLGQHAGYYRKDGSPGRKALCTMHNGMKYGLGGWDYKIFRKDYCENIDGRLGFVCTTTIVDKEWQLDGDHINGDPSDNQEKNIQTLCKCCHAIKTRNSKDYLTFGRKLLGVK